MSAPEEAGTAGQSAAQEERPAVCDEALRTGGGSGKCESTSARTGRPAWRPARCLPGRARGPRRKAAGRSCCRRGRTGARGTATREAAAQEARPAAAGGAERRAQSSESTDLFLLDASGLYQQVIGLVKRHPLSGQDQRGTQ